MTDSAKHVASNNKLLGMLPPEQVHAVFNQPQVDIDPTFLGFVSIYERLSEIIPKHFTVIDLGCAYNAQSFFFQEHKEYVAVDYGTFVKFKAPNCIIIEKNIRQFIEENIKDYDLEETFAICSYVPDWGDKNNALVREKFKNLFVYYPHGGHIIVPKF